VLSQVAERTAWLLGGPAAHLQHVAWRSITHIDGPSQDVHTITCSSSSSSAMPMGLLHVGHKKPSPLQRGMRLMPW
jgi:hypothetical protein